MKKEEIIIELKKAHQSFTNFVASLDEKQFAVSYNQKWSAGQQLEHIYKSVKPLVQGLSLPKFMLKLTFGKANRPSRNSDVVIEKYLEKLANGGVAPSRFVPKTVHFHQKEALLKSVSHIVNRLTSKLHNFSEEELDIFVVPHPLLGKLTLREILYFTIYHVGHHDKMTRKNIK